MYQQTHIYIGKHRGLSLQVTCNFKLGRTSVKQSWKHWIFTSNYDVYTHEYPITLPMDGTGQLSRLNACCLPIVQITMVLHGNN